MSDVWRLSITDRDGLWRGMLIQTSEYGAWIDVMRPHMITGPPGPETDWNQRTGFATFEEAVLMGIDNWLDIGYLHWGAGSVLVFGEEPIAHVHPDETKCRKTWGEEARPTG